jgi:hypothetical protein
MFKHSLYVSGIEMGWQWWQSAKTDFTGDEQNPQNQAIQPDGAPFG